MNAARASRFALVVHAVDGTGALCNARPRNGRWRLIEAVGITCPRCLHRLSSPRYAVCETPTAGSTTNYHVRRVGPEGVNLGGNSAGARTLCGALVGWDINEATEPLRASLANETRLCPTCERLALAPHLAPLR